MRAFQAKEAFSRNLGWITEAERERLSQVRVAIAGVGGVGGHYCEMLARLGVRRFSLADFDQFEIANFNRQNGAGVSALGVPKLEVIQRRILDINPTAEIRLSPAGIQRDNVTQFLEGVDLYLDGLDFFALTERLWLFQELRQLKIPGITVAPIGMGASVIVFTDKSMSFEEYFGFAEKTAAVEKAIGFLAGLAPSLMQRHYLVDTTRTDLAHKKVPSTPMGCYLSAGVAGTMALKLLLGRGGVPVAPWSLHFDAYLQKYKKVYLWSGAKNPRQILSRWFLKRKLKVVSPGVPTLPARRKEPRIAARLGASLGTEVVRVVDISIHGLGIASSDKGQLPETVDRIEVSWSKDIAWQLPVRKVWQSGDRAGLEITEPNPSWQQFVQTLTQSKSAPTP